MGLKEPLKFVRIMVLIDEELNSARARRCCMTVRGWRRFWVGVVIGSIACAGGCGRSSSDSLATPPPKKVLDAMQDSMKGYMQKQMQKNMTKGRKTQ
jgi:hypothetical protein